jgi:hypothetical protein
MSTISVSLVWCGNRSEASIVKGVIAALLNTTSKSFVSVPESFLMFLSHCPWVSNCIGVNNHRHFFFYLVCLELGVLVLVRLTITCKLLAD